MKSVIAGLFLFSFFVNLYSQTDYKVIKVNGSITLKSKGTQLQTGTVFSEQEELLFRTVDATAAVINSVKGRMILTGKKSDLSTASANYLPAMYNISSRGVSNLTTLSDLRNHFTRKIVLLDRNLILINRQNFITDKENFFYIQYVFNSEEINKKLACSGDSLVFDRNSFFTIDGKPVSVPPTSNVTLFYKKGEDISIINSFELILPDINQLKKELAIIIDELKGRSKKDIANEINSYVIENYGNIDRNDLDRFLKLNFPAFDF